MANWARLVIYNILTVCNYIPLQISSGTSGIQQSRSIINTFIRNDQSKSEFCENTDDKRTLDGSNWQYDMKGKEREEQVSENNNIGMAKVDVSPIDICINGNSRPLFERSRQGTEVTKNAHKTSDSVKKTNKQSYQRIKLPSHNRLVLNKRVSVDLPGDIETNVTVLSINPLVIEVENFIDDDECHLLVSLAQSKSPKVVQQQIPNVKIKTVKQTFREWDYDEDGKITMEEVVRLPILSDIKFTLEDVDDMFFLLKMDKNGDKEIDLSEMKSMDFSSLRNYISTLKSLEWRKRNTTSRGAWVWHDEDELLKYLDHGYFEQFHDRISSITDIPSEIVKESEPLQVKHYDIGQFQVIQQDSAPVQHEVSCCMYGDRDKCRNCRYISYAIFLNDVEEGGEMVFPMANHRFQNLAGNSGTWRGYYIYSKSTTGHKYYFQVDMKFDQESSDSIFSGEGSEDSGPFSFVNGVIIDNQISFEKTYNTSEKDFIKYSGKEIGGTKIIGNWWVPQNKRYRGTFFMWNRDYEIFSNIVIDQANRQESCPTSALVVKPTKGKAVFWYNHHIDSLDGMVGDLNQESVTAHCELLKGEKWVAQSWINIIGDGHHELRAWRRGYNLLRVKTSSIYDKLGTNESKLNHEPFEDEFLSDIEHKNSTAGVDIPGNYKHKSSSNTLQALNLLLSELSTDELKILANTVERKLGLQCMSLGRNKERVV